MTKMYVLAKCIITVLGIYAISVALRAVFLPVRFASNAVGLSGGAIILICVYLLLCLAVYFALFRDSGFARRLAGPPKPDETLVAIPDFVKALRIAIVFAGLMLLPGALHYLVNLTNLPVMLRALLFAAFGSEQFSHQLPKNIWGIVNVLTALVRLCLVAYLIIGAPAYIRWQVRKVTSQSRKHDTNTVTTGE